MFTFPNATYRAPTDACTYTRSGLRSALVRTVETIGVRCGEAGCLGVVNAVDPSGKLTGGFQVRAGGRLVRCREAWEMLASIEDPFPPGWVPA